MLRLHLDKKKTLKKNQEQTQMKLSDLILTSFSFFTVNRGHSISNREFDFEGLSGECLLSRKKKEKKFYRLFEFCPLLMTKRAPIV